jgi:hypothetical protein
MLFIRLPARLQHFLPFFSPANIPEITSIAADPDSTGLVPTRKPKKGKNEELKELSGGLETSHGAWTYFIEVKKSMEFFTSSKKYIFLSLLDPNSANLDPNPVKEKNLDHPATLEIC